MTPERVEERQKAWRLQFGACNSCSGYIPLDIAQAGRGVEVINKRLAHKECPPDREQEENG